MRAGFAFGDRSIGWFADGGAGEDGGCCWSGAAFDVGVGVCVEVGEVGEGEARGEGCEG